MAKRLMVQFSDAAYERLQEMKKKKGLKTDIEVIRRAIAVYEVYEPEEKTEAKETE